MSTRSLTRVKDDGKVILTMYRHLDGYVEGGHGDELVTFLEGMVIVDGLSVGVNHPKVANGMGCLAAQLVSHFKTAPGDIYIYPEDSDDEEYNYQIRLFNGQLELSYYTNVNEEDHILLPRSDSQEEIVEFLYPVSTPTWYDGRPENIWRKIQVTKRDETYITGYDLNEDRKFKRFLIEKVVGGASKVFSSKK